MLLLLCAKGESWGGGEEVWGDGERKVLTVLLGERTEGVVGGRRKKRKKGKVGMMVKEKGKEGKEKKKCQFDTKYQAAAVSHPRQAAIVLLFCCVSEGN